MHILVINYEYPPIGGGGGFVTRDFAEAWVASGHKVTVVTSGYSELPPIEEINGVTVVRVPVFLRNKAQTASHASMLSYVPSAFLKCIFSQKWLRPVDIVNTHFAVPSGPAGRAISRYFKVPNILSIHGGDIFDPSKSLSPHKTPVLSHVVTRMLNGADRVVAQSNDTRTNATTYYPVTRAIDIIPLGIKKPVFSAGSRASLGLGEDEFVMCTIGRLVKRKNIDGLLDVMALLSKDLKPRLLIIGDGPEKARLMALAEQLQLRDYVTFCGAVDDERKFQLLQESDIYVSTAVHEGFGLVFLEAMECGLPVICYDRGGQRDFLFNDKTGFLVPLDNQDMFRSKVEQLALDREARAAMATFCRSYIGNYYIENCAARYIELFSKAVAEKKLSRIVT